MTTLLIPLNEAFIINEALDKDRCKRREPSSNETKPPTFPALTGICAVHTIVLPRSMVPQPDAPTASRMKTLRVSNETTSDGSEGLESSLIRERIADGSCEDERSVFFASMVTATSNDALDLCIARALETMGADGTTGIGCRPPPHAESMAAHMNTAAQIIGEIRLINYYIASLPKALLSLVRAVNY